MRRAWRAYIAQPVIVNLRSGDAFRGVLVEDRGQLLELANCEHLDDRGGRRDVDGRVIVERSQITFVQLLPAGDR